MPARPWLYLRHERTIGGCAARPKFDRFSRTTFGLPQEGASMQPQPYRNCCVGALQDFHRHPEGPGFNDLFVGKGPRGTTSNGITAGLLPLVRAGHATNSPTGPMSGIGRGAAGIFSRPIGHAASRHRMSAGRAPQARLRLGRRRPRESQQARGTRFRLIRPRRPCIVLRTRRGAAGEERTCRPNST